HRLGNRCPLCLERVGEFRVGKEPRIGSPLTPNRPVDRKCCCWWDYRGRTAATEAGHRRLAGSSGGQVHDQSRRRSVTDEDGPSCVCSLIRRLTTCLHGEQSNLSAARWRARRCSYTWHREHGRL